MANYTGNYSEKFYESIKILNNQKQKDIFKKAIAVILEKPYIKAEKIKGEDYFRKHIGSGKFRIFYTIDEAKQEVNFYLLRKKDKKTYKNL